MNQGNHHLGLSGMRGPRRKSAPRTLATLANPAGKWSREQTTNGPGGVDPPLGRNFGYANG